MEKQNEEKILAATAPLCGLLDELKIISAALCMQQDLLAKILGDTYSAMLPDPEPVGEYIFLGEGSVPTALKHINAIKETIIYNDKLIMALKEILCGTKAEFIPVGDLVYPPSNVGMNLMASGSSSLGYGKGPSRKIMPEGL